MKTVRTLLAILAVALALPVAAQTGAPVPSLARLDDIMQHALAANSVKGGALAVVKDGRLIFARGYGLADVEANEAVQPDSLFRWGSVSKTATAADILRLAEEGRLDLDARIFDILDQYQPYNGKWGDARLHNVTVRQALHHTGGWDRDKSGDPIMGPIVEKASEALHAPFPPSADTLIRYMLTKKLDFDPGTRWAYSNFGYLLLGCIVEKLSGQSYEAFTRENIFDPAGLDHVKHGSSVLAGRLPGEVKYYDYPGAPLMTSDVSPGREKVPRPYGAVNLDLGIAEGGWVGSAIDLVKMTAMMDGQRPRAVLTPPSITAMLAKAPATDLGYGSWYGFGTMVAPFYGPGGGIYWHHGGSIPGARAHYFRMPDVSFAYVFNGDNRDLVSLDNYVAQAVYDLLATVTDWPPYDLFPQYYAPRIASLVNSASFRAGTAAPASLLSILGADLGGAGVDVTVTLRDSLGLEYPLELDYSGPHQLNCLLPAEAAVGPASVTVARPGQPSASASLNVVAAAPGIFALNSDGLAAAIVTRARPNLPNTFDRVYDVSGGAIVPRPIVFGPEDESLYLSFYATGLRGGTGLPGVHVRIGNYDAEVDWAGAQPTCAGLDQINVKVPRTLAGAGDVDVRITVDGIDANLTRLTFQ